MLALLIIGLAGSVLVNVILFGMVGFLSLETEGGVREKFHSHQATAQAKVAIISVEGLILEGEGFVKRQIDRAGQDADVKAVVLRVDSPGGTMNGSDRIYHQLCQLAEKSKIPIVVSMGGVAASGGYYISMAVGDAPGTIFSEPTTWTGSIGVLIPHYNFSELLKNWGVKDDTIASHPLKTMTSFTKPMNEEERQIFQSLVDDGFRRFKEIVKAGRPALRRSPEVLDKLATGQIFAAEQALQNGLVDKIGFLDDAVDRAIELAHLDKSNVRVVKYKPEASLVSFLLGGETRSRSLDLTTLLELTTPRAFYLCTWLPPLASSRQTAPGGRP